VSKEDLEAALRVLSAFDQAAEAAPEAAETEASP